MSFKRAFTLPELLVIMAILSVLALLLVCGLGYARQRNARIGCVHNERQIALGLKVYLGDFRGTYPGMASSGAGFHREDWIYWRTNSALFPAFEQSPIVAMLPGITRKSFRCPLDRDERDRQTRAQAFPKSGPYDFSYSLTGYGMDEDGDNLGLSSVVDTTNGITSFYPFEESAVRSPSGKIMLAEEPGTFGAHDSPDRRSLIVDGRWVPTYDPLTVRHRGRANVAFVDGHIQAVTPAFGLDTDNSLPAVYGN